MRLKIGGISYRHSTPVTISRTLDESLDSAHVVIPYTDREEPFVPFTYAELDGERWIIGADIPTEVKGLRGKWSHDLTLIEETKKLEAMFVSAKVITKHEYRDFVETANVVKYEHDIFLIDPYISESDAIAQISPLIVAPITDKKIVIPSAVYARNKGDYTEEELKKLDEIVPIRRDRDYTMWVEDGSGMVVFGTLDPNESATLDNNIYLGTTLTVHYVILNSVNSFYYELIYTVTPVILSDRATNKSARDIVEELIADAEQLRYGDTPRIKLSDEEAARLEKIEAPEDAFSDGMSLFEAFLKIGDWEGIGGIPKLQRNVLTFDRWGGTDTVKISGRVISDQAAVTADDYCTYLESEAANMVDEVGNPTIDPFDGGFQTVRTEDGAVFIEDGTIRISTAFPIWQVVKIEVGYVGGKIDQEGGDITPYVYERTEYDLLSEFKSAGFPNSKAYAIYYSKGERGIDGLSFIPKTISGDIGLLQYNAIENILGVKFGVKPKLSSADIVNLPFRVSYVPFINTRARQHKAAADGINAAMAYGQGGSVISARTYGNHLRARAHMLGLPERTMQVVFPRSSDVPSPGQKINETDYIGTAVTEYYPSFKKTQITTSPNYNRINRFIEVKKDIRQFEIPMEGSTDRNILIEDFVVIGEYEGRINAMTSATLEEATVKSLDGQRIEATVNAIVLSTSNKPDKTDGVQVILPVVKMPFGNSILFYTRYKDNYSAGAMSYDDTVSFESSRRMQRDVRYTDVYGNARYLHIDMVRGASTGSNKDSIYASHMLPTAQRVNTGRPMITTASKPVIMNKDARENISLTYQIHYTTNTDLIIGNALAADSPALGYNKQEPARVYAYQGYINPLTGEPEDKEASGRTISLGKRGDTWYVQLPKLPEHTSWAVRQGGKFLFGANSTAPDKVYFNFVDRRRDGVDDSEDDVDNVFITYNNTNVTHVNIVDYMPRGATHYDAYKANDRYKLPASIEVRVGGNKLSPSAYSWNSITGALSVPNVTDNLEVSVFAARGSYTVQIRLRFFDEYENNILFDKWIRGVYIANHKIELPEYMKLEYNGELETFKRIDDVEFIIANDDIKTDIYYKLVVSGNPDNPDPDPDPDPEDTVEVDITIEYWDEWSNNLQYTTKIEGTYATGSTITIPYQTSYNDKNYTLNGVSSTSDIVITLTSDYTATFVYSQDPAWTYEVDIEVEFWDEYGNDLLFTEQWGGTMTAGSVITIPATIYRDIDEETRSFSLATGKAETIIVESNISKSYQYNMD